MSKNKDDKNKSLMSSEVSKFKPGDKPYCYFGKDILNKDVPWIEIVIEILDKGYTLNQIAEYVELPFSTLREVVQLNYENLRFRAGARMITLHSNLYPESYS